MADGREVPWGEEPPFRAPMVVVTHRPHRSWSARGGTNGLVAAVERAHAAAGGKDVAVASGGTLLSQVLRAGPLDELELHIAPVPSSATGRACSPTSTWTGRRASSFTPIRVVHDAAVTHIRYRINGRAKLELDDRGSGTGTGFQG